MRREIFLFDVLGKEPERPAFSYPCGNRCMTDVAHWNRVPWNRDYVGIGKEGYYGVGYSLVLRSHTIKIEKDADHPDEHRGVLRWIIRTTIEDLLFGSFDNRSVSR